MCIFKALNALLMIYLLQLRGLSSIYNCEFLNFNKFWWTCQCCTDNLTIVFFKLACTKISQKKRTRKGKRKDSSSRRESGNEFMQSAWSLYIYPRREGRVLLFTLSYINVYCIYRWYILVMKGKSFCKPTLT